MKLYMGVDPGKKGGIAVIDHHGEVRFLMPMPDTDEAMLEACRWPRMEAPLLPVVAVVEHVHASPQMGVVSAMSFGEAFKACKMGLTAAGIPYTLVDPRRWQRVMQCLSGGDKNVTKAMAKQRFPGVVVTHAVADALLLAAYARVIDGHSAESSHHATA